MNKQKLKRMKIKTYSWKVDIIGKILIVGLLVGILIVRFSCICLVDIPVLSGAHLGIFK